MRDLRRRAAWLVCALLAANPTAGTAWSAPFDSGGKPMTVRRFRRAETLAYRGRFSEALAVMAEALDDEPGFADGVRERAELEIKLADWDAAAKDLAAFDRLLPDTRSFWLDQATIAVERRDPVAALKDLGVAASRPLGDTEHRYAAYYTHFSEASYHVSRSVAEALLGQTDAALADFKVAVESEAEDDGPVLNRTCRVAWHAGLLDLAAMACDESAKTQWVDSFRPFANRGLVALSQKDWAGAVDAFDKALGRNGHYSVALYGRGVARIALRAIAPGQQDLAAARAAEPQIAAIMQRLGVIAPPA